MTTTETEPTPEATDETVEEQAPNPHGQDDLQALVSGLVRDAIQNASNQTERSQQQQDFYIGLSTLGHCRQYAALMIKQTPFSDVRDKSAAFMGTVTGDAIEEQMKLDNPDMLFQGTVNFPIPSGGEIQGHFDIVVPPAAAKRLGIPQMVIDLKSKAELETIKKYGQSDQQRFQLHGYGAACIAAGILDPDQPIKLANAFFDRSGQEPEPYSVVIDYDPNVLFEMDNWIQDVIYAVRHGEDASRDMPREWCMSWCEYATTCRAFDTDAEGLLTDPEVLSAVELWKETQELKTQVKKNEIAFKRVLLDPNKKVSGSTGTHLVRPTYVGPTEIKAGTRSGYTKLSISVVKPPKPPVKRRPKKAEQ